MTNKRGRGPFFFSVFILSIFVFLNINSKDNDLPVEAFIPQFDDEIKPYCNLVNNEIQEYDFTNLEQIEVKFEDGRNWYINLLTATIEDKNFIKEEFKKRFKAKVIFHFDDYTECEFIAKIRISGDWKDHIEPQNWLSSMDVSLSTGNIFGIVDFKLFLISTKGESTGRSEVFTSYLIRELGFLAPRTSLVNVNVNDSYEGKFILQEKFNKEFLEFNNLREGPIIETEEEYFWNTNTGNPFKPEDGKNLLLFGKIVNDNWAYRNINNLQITAEALEKFNNSIFSSKLPASQMDYSYLLSDENELFMFDLINHSLGGAHAISNHQRNFYYNKLDNEFVPIYSDGDTSILSSNGKGIYREDYFYNFENIKNEIPNLINKLDSLNKLNLIEKLKSTNLFLTMEELDTAIFNIKQNLEFIESQKINKPSNTYEDYLKNTENKNINFIYLNIPDSKLEICDQYFDKCKIEDLELYNFEELISLLNQPRNILFGIQKDNFLSKNLLTNSNFDYIQITENVQLITINHPIVELADNNIFITLKNNNQKVIIKPSSIKKAKLSNFNITFNGNQFGNSTFRQDENLLTGCLTFYNLELRNISVTSRNTNCEDSINIINSLGSIRSINISDSLFDGLDIDFSNIDIEEVNISNVGNDCLDLSSGEYFIQNIMLTACNDKGISIGENANFKSKSVELNYSNIGIAVKDSSKSRIDFLTIYESDYCTALYRKKQEFVGSNLSVKKLNCISGTNYVQKGSVLDVGD